MDYLAQKCEISIQMYKASKPAKSTLLKKHGDKLRDLRSWGAFLC